MRDFFFALMLAGSLGLPTASFCQQSSPAQPQTSNTPGKPAKKATTATVPALKPSEPETSQAEPKKPDYAQEGFVIEQLRSSYRFENDGTGRRESVARIRVQSESGVQQWGQLQVG